MSIDKAILRDVLSDVLSGEWGDGTGSIKVLRTTNFNNDGTLNFQNVVTRNVDSQKVRQKSLRPGDIVIEKSGGSPNQPVGRVVYFDLEGETFLCNNFTSVLRPSPAVNGRYLFWFLFASHISGRTLRFQNKTTGILNLKLERYLSELRVPLPPLPIQQRIADILDTADALRRKDRELLQRYDELAQSIFMEMFGDPVRNEKGWEVVLLGQVIKFESGLVDPRVEPYSEMLHVGGDNIDSSSGELFGLRTASELSLKSGKFQFNNNHVLYNKIRPYLNKVALPDFEGICSADMYPLLPGGRISREFLYFVIRSEGFLEYADRQSRRANIPKINKEEMAGFCFGLPPLELQNRFASIFFNLQSQRRLVIECASEDLFNSILNLAFSGRMAL